MKKENIRFNEILANIAQIFEKQGLSIADSINAFISKNTQDYESLLREVEIFNESLSSNMEAFNKKYVEIGGKFIPLSAIVCWEEGHRYTYLKNKEIYTLNINSGDYVFEFDTEDEMEKASAKIKYMKAALSGHKEAGREACPDRLA